MKKKKEEEEDVYEQMGKDLQDKLLSKFTKKAT